jgi:hypothetical protein
MYRRVCIVVSFVAMILAGSEAFCQTPSGITIALADPGPVGAVTTAAIFSHFALGGGFTTTFTLLNTGADALDGNLILTNGADGSPADASLQSSDGTTATGSSIHVSIPQGGTTIITASPAAPGGGTSAGWARVESSGGILGGVSTFQLTLNGVLQTIAGVLSSSPVSSATIPVDNDAASQLFTGYAVANPGASDINIKIVLVDAGGNIVDSISPTQLNPLPAGRQVARFLHQDLPARTTFKGSMAMIGQGGATFTVVALVEAQGASGVLFTAIPVIPGNAPNIN